MRSYVVVALIIIPFLTFMSLRYSFKVMKLDDPPIEIKDNIPPSLIVTQETREGGVITAGNSNKNLTLGLRGREDVVVLNKDEDQKAEQVELTITDHSKKTEGIENKDERPFVVAYCHYPQARKIHEPARESEWIAKFFGPHVFPQRKTVIKPVLPTAEFLPSGIAPDSEEGMKLLGLIGVDIRFCQFGSSEMIKFMTKDGSIKNGMLGKIKTGVLHEKYKHLLMHPLPEGAGLWTHKKRIFWPAIVEYVVDKTTQKPVKPFLMRENLEPWVQAVRGLSLWFEAKRDSSKFDHGRVAMFQPHLVNSFGRRLPPNQGDGISNWANRAGPLYNKLEDILLRPSDFNPKEIRSKKKYFASLVNGHCRSSIGATYTEGTVIREIFTYALHRGTKKPVNNLGLCPIGSDGATKAGLTVAQRAELSKQYFPKGTIDVFRDHKFCIVFENSHVEGYLTEKLLNGYASTSVPVYFGSDEATVEEFLNPKAFVYCHIPMNITSEDALRVFKKNSCQKITNTQECENKFRSDLGNLLQPYFDACIQEIIKIDNDDELYEKIISENLVPHGRELSGLFNGTLTGELVRTVYTVLGYDDI